MQVCCCVQDNQDVFASHLKICGMLRALLEELPDTPLYYTLASLTRTLKCQGPKMVTLSNALINAGYRVSNTHCNRSGFKTDAPPEVCAQTLARAHAFHMGYTGIWRRRCMAGVPLPVASFEYINPCVCPAALFLLQSIHTRRSGCSCALLNHGAGRAVAA